MKIGVISDTHGDQGVVRQIAELITDIDIWLHAGDCSQDAEYLAKLVNVPVVAARGNCDNNSRANIDEFVDAGGLKIWLTHGHCYNVKQGTQSLERVARDHKADIVIYGHTHVPDNHWCDGMLIFNPGSAYGGATWGILEIDEQGQVGGSIISL